MDLTLENHVLHSCEGTSSDYLSVTHVQKIENNNWCLECWRHQTAQINVELVNAAASPLCYLLGCLYFKYWNPILKHLCPICIQIHWKSGLRFSP
jgi:hypothetical protein